MRKEYKFIMNSIQISNFLNFFISELEELHKPNFINSIYYDTSDFYIYRSSIHRDISKFKYRIREYNKSDLVHKEIKISDHQKLKFKSKKFNKVELVDKLYFKNYKLEQKSIVSYSRMYYKFFNSRLTIDKNIQYLKPNSNVKFRETNAIVELKLLNDSFIDISRYFPKNPERFSKFENSITKLYFPFQLS